jgi:hypothetical protein
MEAIHPARVLWTTVALAALLVAAMALALGWADYYGLPRTARPWAALHAALAPSGRFGHGLGIAGSALMLLNLLYLVRRRWSGLGRLGSLPSWLAFHVAAGLSGVALVVAHSAMLFDNPVARVATIAALVVLVTGAMGRWIYGYVPHRDDGAEAAEGELVAELRDRLAAVPEALRGAAEAAERALARLVPPPVDGALAAAASMPRAPVLTARLWLARRRIARDLRRDHDPADVRLVVGAARDAVNLRRRARRLSGFKRLVGTWRGLHRIATFILILTLVAHVLTVLSFGVR